MTGRADTNVGGGVKKPRFCRKRQAREKTVGEWQTCMPDSVEIGKAFRPWAFRADSDINVGLRLVDGRRCRPCAHDHRRLRGISGVLRGSILAPSAMMLSPATTHEGSLLWTLEEIGRLISQSGNALRDPEQHRAPDSAAVRNGRLLGLPAGARSSNLALAATIGACRVSGSRG
jgi:hypothetical protein